MGASKSRRSRSVAIEKNRYGLARPRNTRDPLPVIGIVCDDAKTAIAYFAILKRLVKEKLTLTVIRNPCDRATPDEIVGEATRFLSSLQAKRSRDDHDRGSVWALIDLEQAHDRRAAARRAKQVASRSGVIVVLSDPCYEMWTLLHLADTGESFADCGAVLNRVEREWIRKFNQPFGPKAQADYAKIIPFRTSAIASARKHHVAGDPSWTEIYMLMEEIEQKAK
jgi:hypothetical protein